MLPLNKIRDDLKEIRYYYNYKEVFESAIGGEDVHNVLEKVKRYNSVMQSAPPHLFGLYVHLYVRGYTQEAFGNEFGYSMQHVCRLNKSLALFLQTKITE